MVHLGRARRVSGNAFIWGAVCDPKVTEHLLLEGDDWQLVTDRRGRRALQTSAREEICLACSDVILEQKAA